MNLISASAIITAETEFIFFIVPKRYNSFLSEKNKF